MNKDAHLALIIIIKILQQTEFPRLMGELYHALFFRWVLALQLTSKFIIMNALAT